MKYILTDERFSREPVEYDSIEAIYEDCERISIENGWDYNPASIEFDSVNDKMYRDAHGTVQSGEKWMNEFKAAGQDMWAAWSNTDLVEVEQDDKGDWVEI